MVQATGNNTMNYGIFVDALSIVVQLILFLSTQTYRLWLCTMSPLLSSRVPHYGHSFDELPVGSVRIGAQLPVLRIWPTC